MKDVRLRRLNSRKYCTNCKTIVYIVMIEMAGYCPDCEKKLYTIDTRSEKYK